MKKTEVSILIATAAFSIFFYQQNAGLNFLLFNFLLILIFIAQNQALVKERTWLLAASLSLLSATGILLQSSVLAVFANLLSLLALSGLSKGHTFSVLFAGLQSVFSVASAAPRFILEFSRWALAPERPKTISRIITVSVALLVSLIFLGIYENANPLFAKQMQWIKLEDFSFPLLGFTIFGFLICYGLIRQYSMGILGSAEASQTDANAPAPRSSVLNYQSERMGGILLFVLLNLMLLVLNTGDISDIWMDRSLPEGITLSDFVHGAIEHIGLSILMAIGLIMFLFRKNFSVLGSNRWLKGLSLLWALQTLVMISSAAIRNTWYIGEYALTYRRLGVYAWLGAAALGLVFTAGKILYERSNLYLLRQNVFSWLTGICLCCMVNWDGLITEYNLKHIPPTGIDTDYLFELSDGNLPALIHFEKTNLQPAQTQAMKIDAKDYRNKLDRKIRTYLSEYKNTWQSADFRDKRNCQAIMSR